MKLRDKMKKVKFELVINGIEIQETFDMLEDFKINLDNFTGFDLSSIIQQKHDKWIIEQLIKYNGLKVNWEYKSVDDVD